MARQAPVIIPKFPELEDLRQQLEVIKGRLRLDSLELRTAAQEGADIDYNLYIRVGSRELAIVDSLRYLRNIVGQADSLDEAIVKLQEKIDVDVEEAKQRKTLINDYEKMLGAGSEEGYAIVQELLNQVKEKPAALTV